MDTIKIIKHLGPIEPVNPKGDILFPSEQFDTDKIGGGWYSKVPDDIYDNTPFIPMMNINENPWIALEAFNVNIAEFRDRVRYTCPYTGYIYCWCVPLYILSQDLAFWTKRNVFPSWQVDRFLNYGSMKKFQPLADKNGFRFTKIQRAFLGTGHTSDTRINEGESFLYDAIVSLDSQREVQDFIGVKVWIWFSRVGVRT